MELLKKDPRWPVDFGFKTSWWAVRCAELGQVVAALDLRKMETMPWRSGYERAGSEGFFLAPPVGEWTLILGALPAKSESPAVLKKLLKLSELLGEAQMFATHRVTEYHVWAKGANGRLMRAFGYVGERGEVLLNAGEVTSEERMLPVSWGHRDFALDNENGQLGHEALRPPSENDVVKLAGLWSVNPTQLSANPVAGVGHGIWGKWCFLSDARAPAKDRKKLTLPKSKPLQDMKQRELAKPKPAKAPKPVFKDLAELILNRDFERFQWALENGSLPNMKSDHAATPLWAAARTYGKYRYLHEECVEAMRLLLQRGADPNLPSFEGERPLHKAAEAGSAEMIRLLVAAGADVESRCPPREEPPLFLCNTVEAAQALIEAGADVNARDKYGRTALFFRGNPAIFSTLTQHGLDVNAQDFNGKTALFSRLESGLGLHIAVDLLLDLGADPSRASRVGLTARDVAREKLGALRDKLNLEPDPAKRIAPSELDLLERLIKRMETV